MATRRKHMRLPNGFGSITKLNRNLRRPYLARVTNAKDHFGRPILKSLGYYKTYNEAYMALIEFNKDPYDLEGMLSVSEAYRAYKREVFDREGHTVSYVRAVERAYEQSEALHSLSIRNIRPRHIKKCIEAVDGVHAKANLKNFWNRLLDYAVASELTDRNYAREFNLDPQTTNDLTKVKQAHLTFSDSEMRALWKNAKNIIVRMVLIQCYMGWRPNELCTLEVANVDMCSMYVRGGNKTEAGIGRVVPIHSAVRLLVGGFYDEAKKAGRKYLFDIDYQQYYYLYKKTLKEIGLDEKHRPHDPRKQFITMALKAGADPMAVKRMVGHNISDITEAKYTDRDIEWLRADIEKIDASKYTNSVQMN